MARWSGSRRRSSPSSAERLDERHEARQGARGRPVGDLVEARVRVEGARHVVVERGVERHGTEPGGAGLALGLRQERACRAAPADGRVGRQRVDVEGVLPRHARAGRVEPHGPEPQPERHAADRQADEAARALRALVDREGRHGGDGPAVELDDPDHLTAGHVARAREGLLQDREGALAVPREAVVDLGRALVKEPRHRRHVLPARLANPHGRKPRLPPSMGRFRDPQDPLFQALNSSIRFDYRLAPYDLEQSLAHARMLARSAIITDEDLEAIERGLGAVRAELDANTFVVEKQDEDIHMAIERRLTEIAGPSGGKLHTARSRNDQVATDVAMFVRAHSLDAMALLRTLMTTLVSVAERHLDWRLPGYTHLQRAQPVYLSHHLLAYFWKFRRDLQRFNFCMTATDDLPLGAGA